MRILDRSLSRLPRPYRTLLDWALTLCVAVFGILIFQAEVAKPYRIPTASMEPTLHCGKPADGCRAHVSDRVIANRIVYRFHAPKRGDIVVFDAPATVQSACNAAGVFVKRIIGLPGEKVSMRSGDVFIDGAPLDERYLASGGRGTESGEWPLAHERILRARRQPHDVLRFTTLGNRAASEHHRSGRCAVLAPESRRRTLGSSTPAQHILLQSFARWPPFAGMETSVAKVSPTRQHSRPAPSSWRRRCTKRSGSPKSPRSIFCRISNEPADRFRSDSRRRAQLPTAPSMCAFAGRARRRRSARSVQRSSRSSAARRALHLREAAPDRGNRGRRPDVPVRDRHRLRRRRESVRPARTFRASACLRTCLTTPSEGR